MVDQLVKNQGQNSATIADKGSSQSRETTGGSLNTKASGSLQNSSQTGDIIKQQRAEKDVKTSNSLALSTLLYKVGTEQQNQTAKKSSVGNSPTSLRSRSNRTERDKKHHHRPGHGESSSSAEEIQELNAIRNANRNRTAAAASNRGTARSSGLRARGPQDGPEDDLSLELRQNLVGKESIGDAIPTGIRNGSDTTPDQAQRDPTANQTTPGQELDGIGLNTSTETVKLLDLVGPEAILSFREKLQQVWVTLDDNSARQLDVIARMPATLTGASAMELLMVESPQGIHFVAFLKNKNDFEVLATFDRRALLPESPSRQLIEAGLMSFEQLDSVFKEGGQKIEQSAKELAASRGTNDMVFNELQRLMVQEKKRRRKFRQMIDYFVDKLDELDMEGDLNDAPFVPNELQNSKSDSIGEGQLEAEVEEEISNSDRDEGFTLQTEDGEFH